MKGKLAAILFVLLYGGVAVCGLTRLAHAGAGELTLTENRLLAHIVTHPVPDGSYIVVMRDTLTMSARGAGHDDGYAWGYGGAADDGRNLATWLSKYGEDAPTLAARFIQTNARSARIAFASSRKDGYVVDEDGTYAAYFEGPRGYLGWWPLRAAHPEAHVILRFSRPAYDEKSGLFLVYLSSGSQGGGEGAFYLYRFRNGMFETVAWLPAWIS